jgi:hypothetical protein
MRPRDLTCRGLFDQVVAAFTSIDGRFMRSLQSLVTNPGALTVAYLQGRRRAFTTPLQLFLAANVFFFAMQTFSGARIFSTSLESHLHIQDWAPVAQQLVRTRLAQTQTTIDAYTPVFNRAVALNAKSLIVLMVIPFTFLLPIVFHKSRQPFAAHIVFALHFYTFLLLLFCMALVVVTVDVRLGGSGLESSAVDRVLSIGQMLIGGAYLFVATGTVYGSRGARRILTALTLTVAVWAIVLGYRFALLPITLYST